MAQLQEIFFNSSDKQVTIDQDEYAGKKSHYLQNRLPFRIPLLNSDDGFIEVTVAREDSSIIVHLIDPAVDRVIGRLYLAKPDIFPGAYYVSSMALLTEYQGKGLGRALYNNLMQHLGISFVAIDQSLGARMMWVRLSKLPGNTLYAVRPGKQTGNVFYRCVGLNSADYLYTTYDGLKKTVKDGSDVFVILTKTTSKMAGYIKQHMKLSQMRYSLARISQHADPFAAHLGKSAEV